MIEIKCGDGKIIIGDTCPPIQSMTFPLPENTKEEKGEDHDDAPQSA